MGITEKLANAKTTDWVSAGLKDADVKTIVELAKISAQIERYRIENEMTQKEFAQYMGVSQGMISKWESREYNFTIKSLNEICSKIDLELSVSLNKPYSKNDYAVIEGDEEKLKKKKGWINSFSYKGAIA